MIILVPARGGSKGLPGKNLAEVGGVPLVARAVRTGLATLRELDVSGRVVVSTEDDEIASVAREWGAEVPFARPHELATDEARSIDVVRHAVEQLSLSDEMTVVLLQATSPFTTVDHVVHAVREHRSHGWPVVSVVREDHPLQWTMSMGPDGRLAPVMPGPVPSRRQQAPQLVRISGAVYVAGAGWLRQGMGFVEGETRGVEVPRALAFDVDDEQDLELARASATLRSVPRVRLGDRMIGSGCPCFIIAEAGVNHNGRLDLALQLVDAAGEAGADAVKFQTFRASEVISPIAAQAEYQRRNIGKTERQLDMARRLELSPADFLTLAEHCQSRGIQFLSSPFDPASVDLLINMRVAAIKVGSGELTNHPFLSYVAAKERPIILSTGMATLVEVEEAVRVIGANGDPPLIILHCVSNYPAIPSDCNLRAIQTLAAAFDVPTGWSDHTTGVEASIAAVALGASVVEKHLTLSRTLEGPDHAASLEPKIFADMVRSIREVESALGTGLKLPVPSEHDIARVARRSLFARSDLPPGHRLEETDVIALRPGTGISPARLNHLVGRRVSVPVSGGDMLSETDFE